MLTAFTIVGIVVLAFLAWYLMRMRSTDLVNELMAKRRATCRLVSRAAYVEARHEIPVVLALSDDTIYYENSDLQASFEINRIDDIEYDDEFATGHAAADGCRVLRLRSHGTTFEFTMPIAEMAKWQEALPARMIGVPAVKAG